MKKIIIIVLILLLGVLLFYSFNKKENPTGGMVYQEKKIEYKEKYELKDDKEYTVGEDIPIGTYEISENTENAQMEITNSENATSEDIDVKVGKKVKLEENLNISTYGEMTLIPKN